MTLAAIRWVIGWLTLTAACEATVVVAHDFGGPFRKQEQSPKKMEWNINNMSDCCWFSVKLKVRKLKIDFSKFR